MKASKPIKGIVAGCWDLLHTGHILMFEEIKEQCDHLVVAILEDPTVDRPEKNVPIESLRERITRLRGCKYVDEIVIYWTEKELMSILKSIDYDIRFLGADWKGKNATGVELAPKVVFCSRDHDYSTSNLRKRICQAEN